MASIKKYATTKGHAWRVQYRSPDGRSRTKQGFSTKSAAQAWADKNATDIREGGWVNPVLSKVTVAEMAENWKHSVKQLKPSSQRTILMAWRVHVEPRWGKLPISTIKHSDIQGWVSELSAELSASTVKRVHNALAQILDLAVKDQVLKVNPARGVRLPKAAAVKVVYLTAGEVKRLADESIHPTIVWVLATVGMRWGELAGLRVGDVDVEGRRFNLEVNAVTLGSDVVLGTLKTHEARSVAVPSFVMDMVAPHLVGRAPGEFVFPGRGGGAMRLPDSTGGWFAGAASRAGLAVTPHGLRHVAAGLLIQAGANPKMVARQLGHADAGITLNRYAALWEDGLDAVAAAMEKSFSDVV